MEANFWLYINDNQPYDDIPVSTNAGTLSSNHADAPSGISDSQINQIEFDRLAASSFRELESYGYSVIHTKEVTSLRRPGSKYDVKLENSARSLSALSEVTEQCYYLRQIMDYADVARDVGLIPDYIIYPMPGQNGSAHFYNNLASETATFNLNDKGVREFRYLCADCFCKNAFLTQIKPEAEAEKGIQFELSDAYFQYRYSSDEEWSEEFTYFANDIRIFLDRIGASYTIPDYIVCKPSAPDGPQLIKYTPCKDEDGDADNADDVNDMDDAKFDASFQDLSDNQFPQAQ